MKSMLGNLIKNFTVLEQSIKPHHMSVDAVNDLTAQARGQLMDVNHAIVRMNQSPAGRCLAFDKKGMSVLATLVNALDGLKQKPTQKL